MPWIAIYLTEIGLYFAYVFFAGFALLAGVLTIFIPYETYGRELDKIS